MKVRYRVSLAAAASPRFVADSLLEGTGFETPVPRQINTPCVIRDELAEFRYLSLHVASGCICSGKRFADSPPEGHGSEPAVSARLPRS
jgi:hypothetical protein